MAKEERELSIEYLEKIKEDYIEGNAYERHPLPEYHAIENAIEALKKEPRKGHWEVVSDGYSDTAYICECSECKDTVWVYKDADRKWNYCPNCGADMKEE